MFISSENFTPKTELFCVSAIQLSSTRDIEKNIEISIKLIRDSHKAGARLICLPENFAFLGKDEEKLEHAEAIETHSMLSPFRELSKELNIYIIAGTVPEKTSTGTHTYNTSVLIGLRGETLALYRKIHLFDVELANGTHYFESHHVYSGNDVVVVDVENFKIGMSVCYDLRFPELYRKMSFQGADLIIVPAMFTLHTGKDHWDILLRARAIENQCYVIASGQFGYHSEKRASFGKSQIIDPWGTPLSIAPEKIGFTCAVLDRTFLHKVREELPSLKHRVLSL